MQRFPLVCVLLGSTLRNLYFTEYVRVGESKISSCDNILVLIHWETSCRVDYYIVNRYLPHCGAEMLLGLAKTNITLNIFTLQISCPPSEGFSRFLCPVPQSTII